MRTLANERGYTIVASSAMKASGSGAVINVFAAIVTHPPVDTDAVVAAVGVVACPSILTYIGHHLTLIHIFCAVLP